MALTAFRNNLKTVVRTEGNQTIQTSWQNVYNFIENTAPMNISLESTINFSGDSSVIVRNSSSSTDNVSLVGDGTITIDVSNNLGLEIPPGGIGELKRLGASNVWSFYGYIEV